MNNKKQPWTHEQFLAHERRLREAQKQERDTHFAGFAKLLTKDLLDNASGYLVLRQDVDNVDTQESLQIIARRAYDLVVHALNTCSLEAFEIMGNGVEEVPDLSEWPKESE